MQALFFGTFDATTHPRVRVLAEGLGAHGVRVSYCNVPLGLSTSQRVSMLQNPSLLPRLAIRLAVCWARLVRMSRRLPRPDVVVVGYLGHFDVRLARLLYPRTQIVLDHLIGASDTATDRGVRGGLRQRLLRWLDAQALGAADVVVVDTEEHRATLPVDQQDKAVVVPVGAPSDWVVTAPKTSSTAPGELLSVVFFGLFTPLQGTPVIGEAIGMLADAPVRFTMIGSGQDFDETRRLSSANPKVTWRPWVPSDELPTLVSRHDVCLGIFGTGEKAMRVVPNKVFQGAAAGCALVTSDTPPQRRMLGTAAVLVPPGDPAALAEALRRLALDGAELGRARTAAQEMARTSFVPAQVATPLLDRLNAAPELEVP